MNYEINYSELSGQEKRTTAIKDMQNYIGDNGFNFLATIAMDAILYSHLSFPASFAGVQGYPVVALWDETRQEMRDMTT